MSDNYDSLLDDINQMIISILREDSSIPFIEIAKKLEYQTEQYISELEN